VPDGTENQGVAVAVLEVTLIVNSTWSFTCCPQHLTCKICVPGDAVTDAENEVGSITAVPLSME
jgi:hypothetical protein